MMTNEELLKLQQQQQQQQNLPQLAPAKSYALGQSPGAYAEGQRVNDAYSKYQGIAANKPASYASPYQGQIDSAYQKILNRQPFKYDMNADVLYQQYRDQYAMGGNKAMQNAMGNAAAMTGGYGNSYAQTVGQQTNQAYMQQMNDKLPELYDRAYNRYQDDGNNQYNQLAVAQGMDDRGYSKYRDSVGDWQSESSRAQGDYNTERGFDLDMYKSAVSAFQNQRDYDFSQSQFAHQKEQDQFGNEFALSQFDYQKLQDQIDNEFSQSQFEHQKQQDQIGNVFNQSQFEHRKNQDQFSNNLALSQFDYQKLADEYARTFNQSQFDYQKERDQRGYDFDVSQFDYQKQQDAQARADAMAAAASKGSSGGPSKPQFTADEIAKYEAMIAEEERQKKLAAARAVKTVNLGLTQGYDPYKKYLPGNSK